MLQARGVSMTAADYNYPAGYQPPEAQTLVGPDGKLLTAPGAEAGLSAYPNTDTQFETEEGKDGEEKEEKEGEGEEERSTDVADVIAEAYAKAAGNPYASGLDPTSYKPTGYEGTAGDVGSGGGGGNSAASVYGYMPAPSTDVGAEGALRPRPPEGPPPQLAHLAPVPPAGPPPGFPVPAVAASGSAEEQREAEGAVGEGEAEGGKEAAGVTEMEECEEKAEVAAPEPTVQQTPAPAGKRSHMSQVS